MAVIRPIMHPSDFSPASRAAFREAVRLARRARAELIVVHVLAPVTPVVEDSISFKTYDQLQAAARRAGRKQLDAMVARARKAGVRARGSLLEGITHEAIVREARRQRAAMIVMGTHGRTGFTRFILGSIAGRVVAHAACPVLTVRARGARQ